MRKRTQLTWLQGIALVLMLLGVAIGYLVSFVIGVLCEIGFWVFVCWPTNESDETAKAVAGPATTNRSS